MLQLATNGADTYGGANAIQKQVGDAFVRPAANADNYFENGALATSRLATVNRTASTAGPFFTGISILFDNLDFYEGRIPQWQYSYRMGGNAVLLGLMVADAPKAALLVGGVVFLGDIGIEYVVTPSIRKVHNGIQSIHRTERRALFRRVQDYFDGAGPGIIDRE